MADEKKPSISKAPPPITPIRGGRNMPEVKVRRQPAIALDWSYWPASCYVYSFQAAALSLGINPETVKSSDSHDAVVGRFERAGFPDDATEAEFIKRYRLLEQMGMNGSAPLWSFAEKLAVLPIPPEFSAMTQEGAKQTHAVSLDSALVHDKLMEFTANDGNKINWAHWARLASWTPEEAVSLMMFYEPGREPAHPDRRAEMVKRVQHATRAQVAGNVAANASPIAWMTWAVEQQWTLPRQLINAMKAQEDVLHANVYKTKAARRASLHRGYDVPPENFTIHERGSRREMLDAYAKRPDLVMSPESWATMLALDAAERTGIDDLDTQQRNKIEILHNFSLLVKSLPLRTHLGALWPKDVELPPDWHEGLYLLRDELRAWATEHCPTLLESPLLAAPPATAPQTKPKQWRTTEKRAILQGFIDDGTRPDIASVWLHIKMNAGKDKFPFKSASESTATMTDNTKVGKANLARVLLEMLKKTIRYG